MKKLLFFLLKQYFFLKKIFYLFKCIIKFIIFFIIIYILYIYINFFYIKPVITKGALIINLTGTIVDKLYFNNKNFYLINKFMINVNHNLYENSIFKLVDILRKAKKDKKITGLIIYLTNFNGADQVTLQYLGKSIHEFSKSGKPIYAISDYYNQYQYFIASYANKIYLTPQGSVDLHGMSNTKFFYKSFLDKLKINTHIFRVGNYKSAVEPYFRDSISSSVRKYDLILLNQIWKEFISIISNNRCIKKEKIFSGSLKILLDIRSVNGVMSNLAIKTKLVDKVFNSSVIERNMINKFGWNKYNKSFNSINLYDYIPNNRIKEKKIYKIAVIFVNGIIIDGKETTGTVGSDTIIKQIRNACLDNKIKSIIIRVNSPGGSVKGSEIIRKEIANARAKGKKIVVSMGSIAASGGYWISTPANYIIASPSTITGSIGIFGIINTFENILNSIGIHSDGVYTSTLADFNITKNLNRAILHKIQLNIENGYHNFISLVAQARYKKTYEVDNIGQGHVWTGNDAFNKGLIDKLGDFDDAVIKAAELSNLKKFKLKWYLNKINLKDIILYKINNELNIFKNIIFLNKFKDPQNRYALCLININNF